MLKLDFKIMKNKICVLNIYYKTQLLMVFPLIVWCNLELDLPAAGRTRLLQKIDLSHIFVWVQRSAEDGAPWSRVEDMELCLIIKIATYLLLSVGRV